MMRKATGMFALMGMIAGAGVTLGVGSSGSELAARSALDPMRTCPNRAAHDRKRKARLANEKRLKALGRKPGLLSRVSLGNNPREGQYRAERERLLGIEISNVLRSIVSVEKKHRELVVLYPRFKRYHEIVLEDVPGARRGGAYVNYKRTLVLHYTNQGVVDCVVLDSMTRNIYHPKQWTRRIMRLYYPNIQTIELETFRRNYHLKGTFEGMSPEIQLKGLRLVDANLRTAIYSMDMLIAAFYDLREKRNDWQISL